MADTNFDLPKIEIQEVSEKTEEITHSNDDDEINCLKVNVGDRRRAKSIDFGKILLRSRTSPERKALLSDKDDVEDHEAKTKSKNKILDRLHNFIRRGSDASYQFPKQDKSRSGSIDFGNAIPNSKFLLSLDVPREPGGRRGSMLVQPTGTTKYRAEADDTLASIAARFKSTVTELKSINRLMSTLIFTDQVLYVPDINYKVEGVKLPSKPGSLTNLQIPGDAASYGSRPSSPSKLKEIFSAEAKYVTGGQTNKSGLLTLKSSEVRFDPYASVEDVLVSEEVDINIGIIRHKMSLANILLRASFGDESPVWSEAIKNVIKEIDEEEPTSVSAENSTTSEKQQETVKFLKLILTNKSGYQDFNLIPLDPTSSTGINVVHHFFELSSEVADELQIFLKTFHSDKIITESQFEFSSEISNRDHITNRLRHRLSVAELCSLGLPLMMDTSKILTDGHVRVLREFLPPKVEGKAWKLLYSSLKCGFSLNTLYRKTEKLNNDAVTLILLKDTFLQVFGGVLTGTITRSNSFYGTGESFLFTFCHSFQHFPWSGKNDCIARGCADCFVMGASNGLFGLWIDEELNRGCTNHCETFDNEILTRSSNFQILSIEIWTFL